MGADIEHRIDGTKYDSDKLRMDLITPEMLEALASTLTYGVKKYGDNNWRKGLVFSRVRGAILRHFTAWSKGIDIDEESGLNHIDQVFTNVGFLVTFVREGRTELDDRWKSGGKHEREVDKASTESGRFQGTYADFLKLNNVTREGDLK